MELIDYLFTSYIYIDNYNSLFPVLFSIPYIMTTTFSGPSRLANFREKKASLHDDPLSTSTPPLIQLTLISSSLCPTTATKMKNLLTSQAQPLTIPGHRSDCSRAGLNATNPMKNQVLSR